MTTRRICSSLALILLGSTLMLACDGRSAVGSDDAGTGGRTDAQLTNDGASHPQPDGCSYPTDGCHGDDGCGPAEYCTASTDCLADPCCPECAVCYGRCRPKCKSNADCASDELCKRPDGQCGVPGRCERRPGGCSELLSPVCGCDGKTYSSGNCSAWSAGVSVAKQGSCGKSCEQLRQDYATTLATAQKCCVFCDIADQCGATVPSSLPCGCPTPVNASKSQLLQQLASLQKQYAAGGCPIGACPGCAPPPPAIPTCRPRPDKSGKALCGY
jgi:hypothetical protein